MSLTYLAVATAFFLSALAFFIWRHRKRNKQNMSDTGNGSSVSLEKIMPDSPDKPELDSSEIPNSPVPSELQGARDAAEMPVPHFVAELPGSMPAGYQQGSDIARSVGEETKGTFEMDQGVTQRNTGDGEGQCRRRSIAKGHSLHRTISSPSTPSAGSARREVSSVDSFDSVYR